jgi:hypothetical protein
MTDAEYDALTERMVAHWRALGLKWEQERLARDGPDVLLRSTAKPKQRKLKAEDSRHVEP